MEKYGLELNIRGVDPRIKSKMKELSDRGELETYIEDLLITHEVNLLEDKLRDESNKSIDNLRRKIDILENKVKKLEDRGITYNEDEEELEKDLVDMEDDALSFINDMMSI